MEQAKVINLSLQPLYLYLFVNSKITYVGIYNVILGISSCIFIYFFTRKVNDKKYFKYLNIIFCLFLLLKLNIYNKYLILIIGLFEGLGIKMFEIVSSENIYNIKKDTNIGGYLLLVELIFCITRSIMCLIGYLINMINDMDIKYKLRLAICMSQSKWSGLIYNTKENYEKFDAMLKEVDEEYRTTVINFAKYKLVMFAMAKLMEMETTEQNKVALYLFNSIN